MDSEELINERLIKDECENLYYGFSSSYFYETFEHWLQKTLKVVLKELEDNLIHTNSLNDEQKIALHNQINNFYKIYICNAKKPLKRLKEEIQNLFQIPPNVIIPGTELQNKHKIKNFTDNDLTMMKKEILCMQDKILKEQIFLAKLKQIKSLIDKLQPRFNLLNTTISASKSILSSVSERRTKVLDMHDKSVRMYFEQTGENVTALQMKTNVFFE